LPLRTLDDGHHEIGGGRGERHVGVRRIQGATFIVAYDAGPHEVREAEFQELILISLGIVVLVALALGYWLAGLLTRQVTDLAGQLPTLNPETAHPPLARPGQDPEVASLAAALDDYRARIARMIRREQEFAANASHELRTPITVIRTSCELLLADAALSEKARSRVEMVDAAAERMAEQIQVFLFLAREQTLGASETIVLAECVSEAVEPYRGELERKGLEFTIDVEPTASLQANRQALDIVLSNLVRNAVQHTEHGFVKVGYNAPCLTVSDSGTGIATDDVQRLFQRFYRAAGAREGFGLGLAIVKHVCDLYGWVICVDSHLGKGSAFSIKFP
jgi:signal transduction histidine kinase